MRKRHSKFEEEHEEHIDESWLIPYADILTLLLALFIVLFASSSINISKYQALMNSFKSEFTGTKIESKDNGLSPVESPDNQNQAQSPTENQPTQSEQDQGQQQQQPEKINDPELDKLREKLQKYISDNHLAASISLRDSKRGVEISLKDYILYDSGKAELKPSSFKTLNTIIGLVSTINNPISIEGHTDNVPIGNAAFASNWELSAGRAASVLHYFASKKISESRMQFTGYGEFQPLYPNDTPKHKQANRRVNIVILRNS